MLTDGRTHGQTDDGRKVITIAHPEQSSGELKVDLSIKKVKFNTKLSFFSLFLLGLCPRCCIPSPRPIGPLVPEKIFKCFFSIMEMAAILVM